MAPSLEMKLVQEAREAAKAEAAASGSGRRARAPSRKFLEASGALSEGAQRVAKHTMEAEATVKKELRARRKNFAVSGSRTAEVVEERTTRNSDTAASAGELSGSTERSSGTKVSSQARDENEMLSSKRKLCKAPTNEAPNPAGKHSFRAQEATCASAPVIKVAVGVGQVSLVAATSSTEVSRQRSWGMQEDAEAPNTRSVIEITKNEAGSGMHEWHVHRCVVGKADTMNIAAQAALKNGGTSSVGAGKLTDIGARQDSAERRANPRKSRCEHDGCPKTAVFGVNGVVRYW